MDIKYYRKNVYGNELIYILDSVDAKKLYAITGQKTLTLGKMRAIENVGVTFTEVLAPQKSASPIKV